MDKPGTVASGSRAGGNSGFQAVNLAVQFGCDRIILVGFDMNIAAGIHWHGPHKQNNPDALICARWREALDGAAPLLSALGVRVVNCSPMSALSAFPKMPIDQAINDYHL